MLMAGTSVAEVGVEVGGVLSAIYCGSELLFRWTTGPLIKHQCI